MSIVNVCKLDTALFGFSSILDAVAKETMKNVNVVLSTFAIHQSKDKPKIIQGQVIIQAIENNEVPQEMEEFIKEYCKDDTPIGKYGKNYQVLFIDNAKFFNKTFGISPTEYGEMFK